MTRRFGACDCPTCPDRGLVVTLTGDQPRRCEVCGWLLRLLPEPERTDGDHNL